MSFDPLAGMSKTANSERHGDRSACGDHNEAGRRMGEKW